MQAIDCHCHIYPEKISKRAVESVGAFYGIHMDIKDGTSQSLIDSCKGSPIERHFVYSVATKPEQVESINDFIASECSKHPEFVGFMTLHQDYENPEKEVERAIGMGLKGVKIHPDTQMVNMDDPRLMDIYEIVQGRIPVVMHCGDYRYDYSHPKRMKKILSAFPELVVNAAHFGGWSIFDYALEILEDERCFLDTSSAQELLGPRRTEELCRLFGTDRIMFGSDFPMWSPIREYEMFTSLPFSDGELEKMLYGNALRFIGESR